MIYECEACACVFRLEVIKPSQSDEIGKDGVLNECPCCGSAGRYLKQTKEGDE